jgi:hypothetical protein
VVVQEALDQKDSVVVMVEIAHLTALPLMVALVLDLLTGVWDGLCPEPVTVMLLVLALAVLAELIVEVLAELMEIKADQLAETEHLMVKLAVAVVVALVLMAETVVAILEEMVEQARKSLLGREQQALAILTTTQVAAEVVLQERRVKVA